MKRDTEDGPEPGDPQEAPAPGLLQRRSLLAGAALFSGLGAWHALAGGVARTVEAVPMSVRGHSLADVSACEPSYTGGGLNCPPHGPGSTTCSNATGGDVFCGDHSCALMACNGTLSCSPATCAGAMTGECTSLHVCGTQNGGCNQLGTCDTELTGDCLRLGICKDLSGECNRLRECDTFNGDCTTMAHPCSDAHSGHCTGQCSSNCGEEGSREVSESEQVAGLSFDMTFARTLSRG